MQLDENAVELAAEEIMSRFKCDLEYAKDAVRCVVRAYHQVAPANAELRSFIVRIVSNWWPYVHGRCTIQSNLNMRKEAEELLEKTSEKPPGTLITGELRVEPKCDYQEMVKDRDEWRAYAGELSEKLRDLAKHVMEEITPLLEGAEPVTRNYPLQMAARLESHLIQFIPKVEL